MAPLGHLSQFIPGTLSSHVGCLDACSALRSTQKASEGTIAGRMNGAGSLQGSALIQQVTKVLCRLSRIHANGGYSACSQAAAVLLDALEEQGVGVVRVSAHSDGVCMLAGGAGVGASLLQQQQLVVSGSAWAPSLCCSCSSPVLYMTVNTPEDAKSLPTDWMRLHEQEGLNTFLAIKITQQQPGRDSPNIIGILCLGSCRSSAFMDESWGMLLSMIATGFVPLLTSHWLSGLAGLAASLVDVSGLDDFAEFAATFLQKAGTLLETTGHKQLGLRLGLLSRDGQDILLLLPAESRAVQSSTSLLILGDSQGNQDNLGLYGYGACQLPSCRRLAAANTMLMRAVQNKQQCFVPDLQACLEDLPLPPIDMTVADDNAVGSMVVVPLYSADGHAIGGLYIMHTEAGSYLKDRTVARELGAILQSVLQQEWLVLPDWDELQDATSSYTTSVTSDMSTSYSASIHRSSSHSLPGRSAELGVLQKVWRYQDQQAACASGYLQELQLTDVLGVGGFSIVYTGLWHGSKVAVKVMRVAQDDVLGNSWKSAMEMAALSTLRHPNIVSSYACLTDMVRVAAAGRCDISNPKSVDGSSCSSSSTSSSSSSGQVQQGSRQLLGLHFAHAQAADLSDAGCDLFNILVMERCDRGNLWDAVCQEGLLHRRLPDGRLRVSMALLYTALLDVAAALKYMHSLGLVHLDVKASNVLLQTTSGRHNGFPVAKLGDLGLTKLVGAKGYITNRTTSGTLTHVAPERLQSGSLLTTAADVYSFGILMYELYTGQKPFEGLSVDTGLMKAVFQGLRPQFPASTPTMYRALAEACWRNEIASRPTFDTVLTLLQDQCEACEQMQLQMQMQALTTS